MIIDEHNIENEGIHDLLFSDCLGEFKEGRSQNGVIMIIVIKIIIDAANIIIIVIWFKFGYLFI